MTYGKIFGQQGIHRPLINPRRPMNPAISRRVYPERWLNFWQVREKKTAQEIADILDVPVADVRRALYAKNAPYEWKKAIALWHIKRRRLRDLHSARDRAKRRNA